MINLLSMGKVPAIGIVSHNIYNYAERIHFLISFLLSKSGIKYLYILRRLSFFHGTVELDELSFPVQHEGGLLFELFM